MLKCHIWRFCGHIKGSWGKFDLESLIQMHQTCKSNSTYFDMQPKLSPFASKFLSLEIFRLKCKFIVNFVLLSQKTARIRNKNRFRFCRKKIETVERSKKWSKSTFPQYRQKWHFCILITHYRQIQAISRVARGNLT